MIFYRILFSIDAVIALVLLYFFFVGLGDGSVSSFNILLWLGILGATAAILVNCRPADPQRAACSPAAWR